MTLPLTLQRVESSTQLSLEYGRLMVPRAAQAAALMSNSSRTRHVAQQGTKPMITTPWAHLEGGEAVASPCSVAQWEETSGCQLCTTAGAGDEGWLCEQTWKSSIPDYGVGFLLHWRDGFHRKGKHSGLLRATGKVRGVSAPFCGTASSTPWGSKFPQPQGLAAQSCVGLFLGYCGVPSRSPFRAHAAPSPLPAALT